MPGKVRKCLRDKTIRNVLVSSLSETDKNCILYVFIRYEQMLDNEQMEVKHGEWDLHTDGSGTCSLCGRTQKRVWDFDNVQRYCGKCGAIMDGERK